MDNTPKLSNDMNAVTEGRKKTLEKEVPKASLRDQIPKKLAKKCEDLKVSEIVTSMWHLGNTNRAEWLDRQRHLLQEFEEFIDPIYPAPYDWSSTLHMPIAYTLCRTFHSRMNAAIMSMDPPFVVSARKEANADRAPLVQELMRYTVRDWANEHAGIDDVIDRWVWNWVTSPPIVTGKQIGRAHV